MKRAADFRTNAWNALSGKWGIAVGAGLISAIVGAGIFDNGVSFSFNTSSSGVKIEVPMDGSELNLMSKEFLLALLGVLVMGLMAALVISLLHVLVGSVVSVGYARFNLALIDRREKDVNINQLFSFFSSWGKGVIAGLLRSLYVFLWGLLFVIPGIIASYSYAMTPFILAENPEISASEALKKSKEMMYGNRWRMFCLMFSFIGWDFLCALSCGIGDLWISPYKNAALADFYRDVSGTGEVSDDEIDDDDMTEENTGENEAPDEE